MSAQQDNSIDHQVQRVMQRVMKRVTATLLALLPALLAPAPALALAAPAAAGARLAQPAQPARLAQAQHRVTGTVTHSGTGTPIEGVTVRVQGTAVGAVTNAQGTFTLTAPSPTGTLTFTRIGMFRQDVPINGRAKVNVALTPTPVSLEGVVVTGCQTVEAERVTGAVTVVDAGEIATTPTHNPMRALQGRVAGLPVNAHGDPGGGASVRIRGITLASRTSTPRGRRTRSPSRRKGASRAWRCWRARCRSSA